MGKQPVTLQQLTESHRHHTWGLSNALFKTPKHPFVLLLISPFAPRVPQILTLGLTSTLQPSSQGQVHELTPAKLGDFRLW